MTIADPAPITADELRALKSGGYRYVPAFQAAPSEGEMWNWNKIYDAVVDDVFERLVEMRKDARDERRDLNARIDGRIARIALRAQFLEADARNTERAALGVFELLRKIAAGETGEL